ncbi:hypothetical protein [Streptomyces sp. NPDC126499]
MLDLPDDLTRLRTLERLAQIILRDIRIKTVSGPVTDQPEGTVYTPPL